MAKLSYELNETNSIFTLFLEVNNMKFEVGPCGSESLWDVYNYAVAGCDYYTSSPKKIIV